KGHVPVMWPLKCLRRYGCDSDMFSFESGRRCATGEGIYAFRCKRADLLFRTLQDYLQRRAYLTDDRNSFPVPPTSANGPRLVRTNNNQPAGANTVGVLSVGSHVTDRTVTQTLSPLNSGDILPVTESYLEPNQHVQRVGGSISSASGGPLSPDLASPSSPKGRSDNAEFSSILEVTPLPSTNNNNNNVAHGVSNLYQEFPVREFNNNKRVSLDTPPAEMAPTPMALPEEDFRTYENTSPISLKHSLSGASAFSGEQATQQEDCHSYMNVALGITSPTTSNTAAGGDESVALRTPTTANAAQNYGFKRADSLANDPSRSYENMEPLLTRMRHSKPEIFSKVDLPATPTSFIAANGAESHAKDEERTVNYIVLDLDNPPVAAAAAATNDTTDTFSLHSSNVQSTSVASVTTSNGSNSSIEHRKILQYSNSFDSSLVISSAGITTSNSLGLLPPESPKKPSLGYAMIDFNKTVALSNTVSNSNSVGSPTAGSRRTRHS
ncbi:fibroblast growth factor receptor substrate 2-like, partial [Culicoides brevitarsis]|uniref:fibroblast growth factor receptor substrate 2-like n=1 Tax=Culicoides brevitarsis TaxID=469753 RepID=UPI00307CADA6